MASVFVEVLTAKEAPGETVIVTSVSAPVPYCVVVMPVQVAITLFAAAGLQSANAGPP